MREQLHVVRRALAGTAALVLSVGASDASAQSPVHDVIHLGERYGTPVPGTFVDALLEDPGAYDFEGRAFGDALTSAPGGAIRPGQMGIFGQYDGNVRGTFHLPVLLGYYTEEGRPGETLDAVQSKFFDGPNPTGTIGEYFDQASGGRVQLVGETFDWRSTSLSRAQVTGGVSGLGGSSRVGQFITELMVAADDGSVDWGRYDNDGPDGVPNSGDDDGYIDVLGVVHSTPGGECGGTERGSRIWSHRWSLRAATGQSYVTASPAANGGFIRANDYTIQPVRNCDDTRINDIGVFAHELGHGFGLPDLYGVGGAGHSGIGTWGLMGSGSWGCANSSPERPCFPGAWTREQLGWGEFIDLAPGVDHGLITLRSPAQGGAIYRYRVPGTSTYYLLEYRSRTGFDGEVHAEGLLVWQIDEQVIAENRVRNRVNGTPYRMGVWIRQADGENDLGDTSAAGNRGDGGDPFPGTAARTSFHAGSRPSARTHEGDAAFLTITDVALGSGEVTARVSTGSSTLTLESAGALGAGEFTVRGRTVGSGHREVVAPFESVEVTAAGGGETSPGVRQGFARWADGPTERRRTVLVGADDVTLTAEYGTPEYRVTAGLVAPVEGIEPGTVGANPSSPDFWFPGGSEVVFAASPYPGFSFEAWGGDLAGAPNPTARTLDAPLDFEAVFALDFGVATEARTVLRAGDTSITRLEARGSVGAAAWELLSGTLPEGLTLEADGRITGTVLETGDFDLRVRVLDPRGLTAEADLLIAVEPPDLPVAVLSGPMLGSAAVPTAGQLLWLDAEGNRNGRYDIGDAMLYLRQGGGR